MDKKMICHRITLLLMLWLWSVFTLSFSVVMPLTVLSDSQMPARMRSVKPAGPLPAEEQGTLLKHRGYGQHLLSQSGLTPPTPTCCHRKKQVMSFVYLRLGRMKLHLLGVMCWEPHRKSGLSSLMLACSDSFPIVSIS